MDFNFKKKYGQNFLKHESTINKISSSLDTEKDDLIIEIGPGSGALTKNLAKLENNVICYEIDQELKPFLSKYESDHLKIIYDDFMKRNIMEDIKHYNYSKLKIIGNLPYYITTPIILKIIEDNIPDQMVFMVQKEVAYRFSAKPQNREYGSITVLLNYYFDIKVLFQVKKEEFKPIPNVDSAVIKFTKKENGKCENITTFNELVRSSFQFKRKNLRNNLKNYDLDMVNEVLNKYDKSINNRAEDLSVDIFVELANKINSSK